MRCMFVRFRNKMRDTIKEATVQHGNAQQLHIIYIYIYK